jgi:5-methylcytosine-specific restriction protein A
MPFAPARICAHCRKVGCDCRQAARKEVDEQRGTAAERGYTWRWRNPKRTGAADRFIAANPLCAECERQGKVRAATDVDHIVPHKGDETLFWNEDNWQPLCGLCHKVKTGKGL